MAFRVRFVAEAATEGKQSGLVAYEFKGAARILKGALTTPKKIFRGDTGVDRKRDY